MLILRILFTQMKPVRMGCVAFLFATLSMLGACSDDANNGGNGPVPSPTPQPQLRIITSYAGAEGADIADIWKTDGTEAGTVLIKRIATAPRQASLVIGYTEYKGAYYFTLNDNINGYELWRTDGTADGTVLFKDINVTPGASGGSDPYGFKVFNGTLYFTASNAVNGRAIWKTDGTVEGTVPVRTVNVESDFVEFQGALYFQGRLNSSGAELWRTDGTTEGTVLVEDINSVLGESSYPSGLTVFEDRLYFAANDGVNGPELWKSDGTAEGTVLVRDINPDANSFYQPQELTVFNDALYFRANVGVQNERRYRLWKTNGTAETTVPVGDINPVELREFKGALYFRADATAAQLWKTDGTAEGAVLVKEINPTTGSDYMFFKFYNGVLYFGADDGVNGRELWRSDGTTDGTFMVKNINPAPESAPFPGSNPEGLSIVNNVLTFLANGGANGRGLWKTDGTSDGTVLLEPLNYFGSS